MPPTKPDDRKSSGEDKKEVLAPVYTPDELKERAELISLMCISRDDRESPHPEFDDMTYSQYYDTNKRADMSYIPAKKNKADDRIVTGYTREKDTTLLSALLKYNFQPDITVYNSQELIVAEMGNNIEDIVKKTRELEDWNTKRSLVYRELIAQGDVFVEEMWEVENIKEYENSNDWRPGMKIADADFTKVTPRKIQRCSVGLKQGKNVYLGNFWLDDYNKQGLVFSYDIIDRDRAEAIYGNWDRWECVPDSVDNSLFTADMGVTYTPWSLWTVQTGKVAVLKIQKKYSNHYQIMLNGVTMLPYNYPLKGTISPDGEHTIKHAGLERINGCAYSKGQPAKTKVDQGVHDTFLRLMILREKQAGAPPMGYKGKRVLSPDIYTPGKINNNMKEGDLFPLLPAGTALGSADFSMYQLIKQMMEDKTINATFSGEEKAGQVTLGQLQLEKQQQLMKLGVNFDAVKNLERTLCWARIGNIIMNYGSPIGDKVVDVSNAGMPEAESKQINSIYRAFSVETTLSNGAQGIKQFEFTDKQFPSVRDQQKEQEGLSEYYGKPVEKIYVNGPAFMTLLKYRWIVNIKATEEDSDDMERQQFTTDIREAKELFGPDSVNDGYAKEKFAIKIGEDPTKFFVPQEKLDQQRLNAGQVDAAGNPVAPVPTNSKPLSRPQPLVPAR